MLPLELLGRPQQSKEIIHMTVQSAILGRKRERACLCAFMSAVMGRICEHVCVCQQTAHLSIYIVKDS